jgi:hypothetical protein
MRLSAVLASHDAHDSTLELLPRTLKEEFNPIYACGDKLGVSSDGACECNAMPETKNPAKGRAFVFWSIGASA